MNGSTEYNGAELFPKFKPRVITRARGDIPGCVPAVDVFIEVPAKQAAWNTWNAADNYIHLMMTLPHDGTWENHPIHNWKYPAPFRNPAPATKLNYYNT